MRPVSALRWILSLAFVSGIAACAPTASDNGEEGSDSSDLSRVPSSVRVNGHSYDVETEYIPRVVQCENPGAPVESLKAQAIAARTFLTYRTRGQTSPSIGDGQQDQVFTCPANHQGSLIPQAVRDAVNATKGQVILHGDIVIAGFFVAGASRNAACAVGSDPTNTERFVTVNVGHSGTAVHGSSIGNKSDPANRGAMGQLLANCLATRDSLVAAQILQYFYGADIQIRGDDSLPPVPTPTENDPATMPTPPDPTTPATDPGTTPATTSGVCWSYTMQSWVHPGACVQSLADHMWYQCGPNAVWLPGVDTTNDTGPAGACTLVSSL